MTTFLVIYSALLATTVNAQVDFTLVQGGKDATPQPRVVVPSRTVRLQDHTRKHRELPNVIFAPVEGSRVLTKTAFINANSKETSDEAFKIYEHFLATKGQSVLAQVADPFFVTQPPERTTIATPSEKRAATRRHPFDAVGISTTTVPTFTMASVTIEESGPAPPRNDTLFKQVVQGRSLRREEQRYPSEAKPVVRARMIASPVVGHQPSSLVSPTLSSRDLSAAPTALPLAARNNLLQFGTAPPQASRQQMQQEQQRLQQQQQQQQQQQHLQQQQFLLGPPLVGFPQAVQSPFRSQFADQPFVPDMRNPDEVAWANYMAARYNEQNRQAAPFRATAVGGSFTRNRQPGRPIPLPTKIEMNDPEMFAVPASPFDFDEEQKRSLPQTAFAIDETGENFEKPSNRLRNYFARFPPYEQQQPQPFPGFVQQPPPFSAQPFFLTPQQIQQQQLQQQQLQQQEQQRQQEQFRQLQSSQQPHNQQFFTPQFVDRSTQRFEGQQDRASSQPQQLQQQFTTPAPFFSQPTTNAFYNGPGQPFQLPNHLRREIAPSPTLISQPPQPQLPPFGFIATTTQLPQFQPRPSTNALPPPFSLPNPLDLFTPPPPPPQQPPPAFAQPSQHSQQPVNSVTVSRPRSALSPNQKLDSCCRKQGVNPNCQNLCNFDSFNDKTLVGAFLTGQCPGDQMGKAFDCASTKADHNDCCVRGGLGSFLGGKCLPFCNTHKDTPANVLDYLPCLQVFRVIRDCFQDYQRVNPNIFGD